MELEECKTSQATISIFHHMQLFNLTERLENLTDLRLLHEYKRNTSEQSFGKEPMNSFGLALGLIPSRSASPSAHFIWIGVDIWAIINSKNVLPEEFFQ